MHRFIDHSAASKKLDTLTIERHGRPLRRWRRLGEVKRIAGLWRPTKIYTSPMGRCVETGAVIAEACGVAAEVCGDLNDIDYGAWQFKTFERAQKDDPVLFAAWFATPQCVRFPRGESLQDVAARAGNVVRFAHAWLPPADPIAMRFGRRALR